MKLNKEQQEIAFRCFVEDTEKLINALKDGHTLTELVENCEIVCGYTCSDGYESGICNINRWLNLLQQAKEKNIIPLNNVTTFLEYIISSQTPHKRFRRIFVKMLVLLSSEYQDFKYVKNTVVVLLSAGIDLNTSIETCEKNANHPDNLQHNYYFLMGEWLKIMQTAKKQEIIPGGDLLDFLKFI